MKRLSLTFILLIISLAFISCGSVPKENDETSDSETIEQEEETQIISDEDEVVDVSEEPVSLVETDEEEYLRSTTNLSGEDSVTKDEFAEDKAKILEIIAEMQKIMEKEDFSAWMEYIAPDSIRYYSNPVNIRKAQKKLPDKTKQLNGIEDYFKYVFIPARKRSEVTEIRYVSKTNIKAVELKDNGKVVAYYQFVKLNDKWLIHIPSL
ncbi:MAG: hypothetical protein IJ688_09930 [Treponema sp.]|nr:hypothetical protein [Treponema sp.]